MSAGCDHCYALTLAKRLKAMGNPRYQVDGNSRTSGPGFGLTMHWDKLKEPLRWSGHKPRRVFVNSMSDLFHARVPVEFLAGAFAVMARSRAHTFMILTKRPERMPHLMARLKPLVQEAAPHASFEWPLRNVWLGTSVENQERADQRIPKLLGTPAAVRFLSCEPLLGPVDLRRWMAHLPILSEGRRPVIEGGGERLTVHAPRPNGGGPALHWVIVGGESGSDHRPFDPEWARSLRDQSVAAGVAFFFKQHGGRTPKAGGRTLDGRTWDELPYRAPANAPA